MKFLLTFFLAFTLMLTSCTDEGKEDQLKKREEILLNKEKEFSAKEKDYQALTAMRDSLEQSIYTIDTVVVTKIPESIIGKYNGKMICTESNCTEHVIGDSRNDIWEVSQNEVKIINKSGSEKIYQPNYSGSEIKLTSELNLTTPTQSIITLQVPLETSTRIKGIREFTGNNCIAKFSVDLEKIKN